MNIIVYSIVAFWFIFLLLIPLILNDSLSALLTPQRVTSFSIAAVFLIYILIRRKKKRDIKQKNILMKKENQKIFLRARYLTQKYRKSEVKDILTNNEIKQSDKLILLESVHGYSEEEAMELTGSNAKKNSGITTKPYHMPFLDDNGIPVPNKTKEYVWHRNNGKCAECGGTENLRFSHIIPVSKGGVNTPKNIRLLCDECNREKDSISRG
jgi:hypothetical protein